MQVTPPERVCNEGECRCGARRQACTSVNNIRESSYKIFRSRSNRADHSLCTKKHILIVQNAHSLSKKGAQAMRDAPKTPINYGRQQEKHGKTAQTCTALHETISMDKSTSNIHPPSTSKPQNAVAMSIKGGLIGGYELDCLQAIWQNTKILKGCELFASELRQLQLILQKMLFKLDQQQNCLTKNGQNNSIQVVALKGHQLKATSDTENMFSDHVQQFFQQGKINCVIDNRESVKSSYGSLKIENEEFHKWEYLNIYRQENEEKEGERTLKDITSSCRINCHSNSLSSNDKGSTFRRDQQPQWQDRIYLRSIVKRNRQTQNNAPLNQQNCCIKREVANINNSFQCHLFECDANGKKDAPSSGSSGSSQSKRQALNQIISMLNKKYQRNLKCESNKVFI